MGKDIWEDMLGPDAPAILKQAAERHGEYATPTELEAVEIYASNRAVLTEAHKAALCDLLTAVADDFSSRRRAAMLRDLATRPPEEDIPEDDWIPDEEGRVRAAMPADTGDSLRAFLDDLDAD